MVKLRHAVLDPPQSWRVIQEHRLDEKWGWSHRLSKNTFSSRCARKKSPRSQFLRGAAFCCRMKGGKYKEQKGLFDMASLHVSARRPSRLMEVLAPPAYFIKSL